MAKHDLAFEPPIMNAAGMLGFFPDPHGPVDWSQLGAFVTNPISTGSRTPAHGERFAPYKGGFLLHTGYPNPGLQQVIRRYHKHWGQSPVPVLVHLLGGRPDEMASMARQLEGVEGVAGLEVGVQGDASPEWVVSLAQAATGELPVILRLPFERAAELSAAAIKAGAMAISLAPPRGALPGLNAEILHGRLYGPAVLPMALKLVDDLARAGIPTMGGGGVYRLEDCQAMLELGAMAVQLDTVLWRSAGHKLFI